MSIINELSPEQIKALVAGETISGSQSTESASAVSPEKKEVAHNPEATPATSFKPRAKVNIEHQSRVSAPNVRGPKGDVVSRAEDRIAGPSATAFDNLDHARIQAEAAVKAEEEAAKELKRVASPEQLLNQLNGLRRIVEKQQKEIAALKKASKGTSTGGVA